MKNHKICSSILTLLLGPFSIYSVYAYTEESLPLIDDSIRPSKSFSVLNESVPATPKEPFGPIFDHHSSPYVGANALITVTRGYQFLDDQLIPTTQNKTASMAIARLSKVLVLEGLLFGTGMVAQHQIFGHGFRAREFGIRITHYRIAPFSGSTTFDTQALSKLSLHEQAAFDTGGIEANTILSEQLRDRWLDSNLIDSREANFYAQTSLDQTIYAIKGKRRDNTLPTSHDVNAYIDNVNAWHQTTVLTGGEMRKKAWLDLADPFLVYSFLSMANYAVDGRQQWEYPMINIFDYCYLPAMRMIYAPYGSEYQLNNFVRTPDHLIQISFRKGQNGTFHSWGMGLEIPNLFQSNLLKIGIKTDFWRQPTLFSSNASVSDNKSGIAFSLMTRYQILELANNSTFHIKAQLGYKTTGYVSGEILKHSPIIRLGFGAIM